MPGTSFSSAVEVEPGTYQLEIRSGERHVLAVPLSWGQHLQAQIDADLPKAAYDGAGVHSGFDVRTIGPTRTDTKVNLFADAPKDWRASVPFGNMWIEDDKHWRRGAMTVPIEYSNRAAPETEIKASALPGYTYVDVGYRNVANDAAVITYDLTLKVFGETGQDAPAYADGDDILAPDRPTSGSQPDPAADPDETTDATAQTASRTDDELPWLPIGVGFAGLLLVAGGVAAVLLARRPKDPAPPAGPQQPWGGPGQGGW